MDLNQAEVAVTTQHLIDMGQEKDNLLQMSDFGDMGEFLCTCSELFPEEETPEYRYTKWEEIPDLLINREWLCPNFFEIREAMEQLEEPDKDCFFDWCDRYGHDISTEDPHLLVAHYIELYGNAAYMGLLAHFTQIYHLYNLLIYNILRRNLQLFITEFCIFSPCIIFISNKNSDKSIEILHISPKYITSVDNLMIHIFSSTFNFLYSFTPSDRLESKS